MTEARDRFRAVPARYDRSRPLIGVVGEIFCRLNQFANADLIRLVEEQGGECWLADIAEWVWYVDDEHGRRLADEGRSVSEENLVRKIKSKVQLRDEHAHPRRRSPTTSWATKRRTRCATCSTLSYPYLPYDGALGEMVLSTGKAIYLQGKGADGIIDVSPFTCMNGIVTEAIYPAVSRDLRRSADPHVLLRRHAERHGARHRHLPRAGAHLSAPQEAACGATRRSSRAVPSA